MLKFLSVLGVVILLQGCGREVNSIYFEEALKVCDDNGGVETIAIDSDNSEDLVVQYVVCNNGFIKYRPVENIK